MLLPTVLAVSAFEDMLNKALDLDPATRLQLNQKQGRTLNVNVQYPHISILVYFDQDRVRLTPSEQPQGADASVSATSFDLIKQALQRDTPIMQSGLVLEGDVFFLQELQRIGLQLDIDWEMGLSQIFGDVTAHQIGQGLRSLFNFAQKTAAVFLQNGGEYLREEAQLLPARWQIDDFIEEVQELRTDIERLEARIALFKQQYLSTPPAATSD
ncbi:ubiquinone biosynthesis accessory factor UbiJ [Agitococcus lubricus]|uniref:Ubiquinone biosynthesis accessory factor UbiJ n=1 Tax=Agitococcus lubricus TaxID=1077255 RepID=A0A2T5IV53_9GAMM|nr:SCP2 sterol-binding domain-containing protein [Agitococcus lubricus]PTQ87687.1 ubiquinone biosynthesis protein UbiJ [Agitococcus lubricus]